MDPHVRPLQEALALSNRGQGVGFCVGLTVLDRPTILRLYFQLYSVVAVAVPFLLPSNPALDAAARTGYACAPSWTPLEGRCFKIFGDVDLEHTGHMTWPEAEASCVAKGGHLASVASSAEHDGLYAMLHDRDLEDTVHHSLWIGLKREEETGVFTWR